MELNREHVHAIESLIDEHGLDEAASLLDIHPLTLARARHGSALRRGTIAVLLLRLAELEAEADEADEDIDADTEDDEYAADEADEDIDDDEYAADEADEDIDADTDEEYEE